MRCKAKKALITGAGQGLGRAIALALAEEGADIAAWDINLEAARETCEQVKALGRTSMAHEVDVSDSAQVNGALEQVMDEFGRLDILINNAGICPVRHWGEISEADWDRVMAVNLKGTFLCAQAVTPIMIKQKSGRIINLASVAGKLGSIATGAPYAVSKAGVIGLTKTVARSLAPHGITVNALAPGPIETAMIQDITQGNMEGYLSVIPLGRIGNPLDVAKAAVYLASDEASFLTGEILDINGGMLMD